ncbi:hypothetical protein HGRIS_009084 [Hohenbuehelia grisea]|uniref:Uncharacterized protein n=1 Tax=Hohenbuehelia grisea TaxID=104357 RepID=A0ABR3J053_9AGAR
MPPVTYVNVPADHETNRISFEEVRVQDYLKAYTSTGRPPVPVPQEPTSAHARLAQGLPPLWKPYIEELPGLGASGAGGAAATSPESLPQVQRCEALPLLGEVMQSITMRSPYNHFSFEELRYYACLRGMGKHTDASTSSTPAAPFATPSFPSQGPRPEPGETFESISTRVGYQGHSPEEHRIAYLLSGRELNSEEIFQRLGRTTNPSAPAPPPTVASIPSGTSQAPSNPFMSPGTALSTPTAPARVW